MTLRNGLTIKQDKIAVLTAKEIIEHGKANPSHVGLQVFETTNPNSARVMTQEVLQNPAVKERIEDILAQSGITTSTVAGNFQVLTAKEPEKISAEVFLKANIELAKLLNLYPDKKSTHLSVNLSGKVKSLDFNKAKEEYQKLQGESKDFLVEAE